MEFSDDRLGSLSSAIGCSWGKLPFKHLGLWIGINPRSRKAWDPIINKCRERLSGWKSKNVSMGGRITLIKSVLSGIPLYYIAVFKAPKVAIRELEKIRRNFLWGSYDYCNKMNKIAWSKVCRDKKHGGLGIGSLAEKNFAIHYKWGFRFNFEIDSFCGNLFCVQNMDGVIHHNLMSMRVL